MVIKENYGVDIEQDLKDTYGDFKNFLMSFGMLYSNVLSNEPGTFSLDRTGWGKLSKLMDDVDTVSKKLHTIERNLTLRKD